PWAWPPHSGGARAWVVARPYSEICTARQGIGSERRSDTVTTIAVAGTQLKPAVWRWVLTWSVGDIKRVLPTIIFFFLGFALVLWAQRILLQEQQIEFSDFLVATMAALIVGTVLVRDHIPFMRRFEGAALIPPILVKTTIYSVCVFLVKLG